jgi:hypothetical protein
MEHLTNLCVCGCGQKAEYAASHCGMRHRMNRGITEADYLVEDRGFTTPCWIWAGRSKRDYVQTTRAGRSVLVHRLMYEQEVGPIPPEMTIDHLCRVKWCLNPAHLEAVTLGENARRSNAKLTVAEVSIIRRTRGESAQKVAARFGISDGTVYQIWKRKTWREVD